MPLVAIAGCHSSVLWLGGGVTTNFAGVDVVPLQGANLCCISSCYIQGHQFHLDTQENNNEFCLKLLADVTLFSTLIKQKLFFAIWGLCWYNLKDRNGRMLISYTATKSKLFQIHHGICGFGDPI